MNQEHASPSSSAAAGNADLPAPVAPVEVPQLFSVGGVLSRGLALYARIFVPLSTLTVLIFLPWIVVNAASAESTSRGDLSGLGWLAMLLSIVSMPLASAASVCAIVAAVRGEPVRVAESLRMMAPRALGVVGAAILGSLAVGVGSMLCLVPGLIALAMLYVMMPALLLEGATIGNAFQRSMTLTHGHRIACFVLALVPFVVNFGALGFTTVLGLPFAVTTGITSLASVLGASLGAVFATLAYLDLRSEKEPAESASQPVR